MTRWSWIFYFLGAALVLGSWIGLVSPRLGWIGWGVTTAIVFTDWMRLRNGRAETKPVRADPEPAPYSPEEMRQARREIDEEEV